MTKVSCTRRLQFCAGHRVMGHESKCSHLHGHNYVVFLTAEAPLDDVGRVIDFSVLKARVGTWLDVNWDHGLVLHRDDHAAITAANTLSRELRRDGEWTDVGKQQKTSLLPYNPTAENMAKYLLEEVCPRVLGGTGVEVTSVTLWETENCYATASRPSTLSGDHPGGA